MDVVALFLRFGLAAMFVVAAVTKALDPRSTQEASAGFGAPSALGPFVAVALPLVELVIALALVPASLAVWGAVAAVALLTVFVIGAGVALARGRRPDCHCFGALHRSTVGPGLLVRNALLAGAAIVVVVAGGGSSVPAWWHGLGSGARAAVIVVVVLGALVLVVGKLLWQRLAAAPRPVETRDAATTRAVNSARARAPGPGSR